ncbi:MAG: CoB--CoM heterodisulfide reductase iron-sulfur subunit A family protein, partial [Candidatus Bathyarchaeota archaeon]
MSERIGVYVCHCGTNIAKTVNVAEVTQFASKLKNVAVARDYKYMCSDPGQALIKQDIKKLRLTRVVVASCSPTLHELTFRNACEQAGLNPFLFQMVNVREHCSWVTRDITVATTKAKELVASAVNRVIYHESLQSKEVPVNPNVLVVGGGITGIEAALHIANSGKKVYLVEREPTIGGHMAQFDKTFPTLDCAACILTPKMVSVGQHDNITLLTYSEVEEVSGHVGNFKVKILKKPRYIDSVKCVACGVCAEKCPIKVTSEFDVGLQKRKAVYIPFPQAVPSLYTIEKENCIYFTKNVCKICETFCDHNAVNFEQKPELLEVDVGAIIIATGFDTFDPSRAKEYGYGRLDNVISSMEFERLSNAMGPTQGNILLKNGAAPSSVAILHCIGSRDENYNEHCSRLCCMHSLKFAHLVREKIPKAKIYEFYIDIRAAGKGYDEFYKRVLNEDVIFIRGKGAEVTNFPETRNEKGKLIVKCEDTLLGIMRRIPVDM